LYETDLWRYAQKVMNSNEQNARAQDVPATAAAIEEGDPPVHLVDAGDTPEKQRYLPQKVWHCLEVVNWMPPWCRWDADKPPEFSMGMNILFAFAGAFTVANLYYNHPILNVLANDFDVPYITVSRIPTLMQAGYAAGLLFVCPLGDLFPRRPFVLSLVFFTATLWYVLHMYALASS
jgi:hypothetical protein